MSQIIRWNPSFDAFEDMESMFSNNLPARRNNASFVPAVDMYEEGENVIIETQLAGINPDKVDISIENDTLSIRGESEKKSEVEDQNYYRKEIRRGSFYRSVSLPASVDGDKAIAIAADGILKITVPKMGKSKAKKIIIKNNNK